jgi:nucleoside-diphosphate-sugar epimerase
VYGNTSPGPLSERTACIPADSYGRDKLDAENIFEGAHDNALETVTLRLPIVYGPWSYWSSFAISQLKRGRVVLPNGGKGICNALYVDDAVRAIVCALTRPTLEGPLKCLVSGQEPVAWKKYYEAHGKALRTQVSIGSMELSELQNKVSQQSMGNVFEKVWRCRDEARIILRIPGARTAYEFIKPWIQTSINGGASLPVPTSFTKGNVAEPIMPEVLPNPAHLTLLANQSRADMSFARSVLGFQSQVSFELGAEKTVAWARWANLTAV